MSDFVTRLVERQAGTASMVQPRRPSMFASTMSRPEPADLPLTDSPAPVENASHTPSDSAHSSDHGNEVLIHSDQSAAWRPISGVRSASKPAEGLHRAESAPSSLVRKVQAMVTQSAHAMPVALRVDASTIQAKELGKPARPSGHNREDRVASVPSLPPMRIAPPPLVNMRHDAVRTSAAPPPVLVSGMGIGRRMDPVTHTASIEPAVEVTIGRIEVTAVSAAPDQNRKPVARRPAMSLEEYLTRRQGGRP